LANREAPHPICCVSVGRSLELGGHCRTGLEDNVRLDKDKLAPSNAELVKQVRKPCEAHWRYVATVT
jgi:uncharacterized protein (DUF849 family)